MTGRWFLLWCSAFRHLPDMDNIPNILAERYASASMKDIWSPRGRVILERDFWIAVMAAQRECGLDIPEDAIASYEQVKDKVDFVSIEKRERKLLHDVKARIEEFNALAGHEHIHKGLTSRDLTENIEQLQVYRSLKLVLMKAVAAIIALGRRADEFRDLLITARTHNAPAQPTTMGKRMAMFGQELQLAIGQIERLIENYTVRGLKGAVGTQVDLLTLFEGDSDKVSAVEEKIVGIMGIPKVMQNVGQVYPRSLDFEVVSALYRLAGAPGSYAKSLRLMAGYEIASEGFSEEQVGSSAMPHKMNSRNCERINGLRIILEGCLTMTAGLIGDQWNEGDVSCSVVRRVALPDSFFAIDGLFETFLTVLDQMEVFPVVIEKENQKYLPFLAVTTILMEAVKAGAGREAAHAAIREHAIAVTGDLRSGRILENDLIDRLAADKRLELNRDALQIILQESHRLSGSAPAQVDLFLKEVSELTKRYPEAAKYKPQGIL